MFFRLTHLYDFCNDSLVETVSDRIPKSIRPKQVFEIKLIVDIATSFLG